MKFGVRCGCGEHKIIADVANIYVFEQIVRDAGWRKVEGKWLCPTRQRVKAKINNHS